MREFFRGWKRKAGCVTLLSACVFAAGWVRSTRHVDFIEVAHRRELYYLFSGGQQFYLARNAMVRRPVGPAEVRKFYLQLLESRTREYSLQWSHRSWPSSGMLLYADDDERQSITLIPYWSVVVPLTAISAWLLLSKRPAKPVPPLAPVSENV